jgi:hypothetical protein
MKGIISGRFIKTITIGKLNKIKSRLFMMKIDSSVK